MLHVIGSATDLKMQRLVIGEDLNFACRRIAYLSMSEE
jgi:hypothetical protein